MKKILLFLICLSSIGSLTAQTINRVEVLGRIVVADTDDIEGITIYNTTTNVGTVSDAKGEFKINVGLLDIIEISALQFETITVKIDLEILESKQLTVFLVEHINRLNEVVIMPYGLTGVLSKDLGKFKTFKPDLESINFGIDDIGAYEFADDYHSEADMSLLNQGEFYNGLNMVAIANTFLKPLFKKKDNKNEKIVKETEANLGLRGIYSFSFISENFGIPNDQVEEFINHVDRNIDSRLLEPGQEMQLIEYLSKESKVFLSK
ncbi:carboxypeptidase-like regulatory domain-containing protein [Formosa sp. 4Alg 33]|uniref:carboxypeptidase-like regulatory domain-containing protein n=1 Tax=Formosa sp. 4Alg 33 TaxID=3382189 RepID=UPI003D9C043A